MPKIIVVGAAEAGKSTLVEKIGTRPLNLEVDGRTVALDHGTLRRDDAVLSLIGVPGQARFEAVREALVEGAVGAVWVQRPSRPQHPPTAELLAQLGIPYLVFFNRHGEEAALPWTTPSELASPVALVEFDLRRLGPVDRMVLEQTIWRLVAQEARL